MQTSTPVTARLLVPLDGSDLAAQALAYALALQTSETEVVLAHVLPEPEPRYDANGELAAIDDALDASAAAWQLPTDRVHTEVSVGDPAEILLEMAAARACSLVVLASHGRGALGRWRFGSVADRLARGAAIPTLIMRPDQVTAAPGTAAAVARLVVPLDGSPRAERALPVAGALARQLGVPVLLVRVVAPPELPVVPAVGSSSGGVPVPPVYLGGTEGNHDRLAAARDYLEGIGSHPAMARVQTLPDVREGDVAPELLAAVAPGDLVVLTSRGRGGVARWLLGSVAEKLVRHATAPVCLVPTSSQ